MTRPSEAAPPTVWAAIIGLAVVCTGIAFVVFFALIDEIGPVRSTLITFVNPAVAVALGAIVLGEELTLATLGGFCLVVTGCWLATRPQTAQAAVEESRAGVSSSRVVRNPSSAS